MNPTNPPHACPDPPRRPFFRLLTLIFSLVASAAAGIPLLGYFLGTRKQSVHWVRLGSVEEFPREETRFVTFDNPLREPWDGIVAQTGVFVRFAGPEARKSNRFLVLAANCAHLGCPVSFFPQSGLFMCPCHGGVYYANGERASGPPPRGLYHCIWRVVDGQLEIQAPHYPTLQDTLKTPV